MASYIHENILGPWCVPLTKIHVFEWWGSHPFHPLANIKRIKRFPNLWMYLSILLYRMGRKFLCNSYAEIKFCTSQYCILIKRIKHISKKLSTKPRAKYHTIPVPNGNWRPITINRTVNVFIICYKLAVDAFTKFNEVLQGSFMITSNM